MLIAALTGIVLIVLRFFRGPGRKRRTCAHCGAVPQHGYSQKAESEHKDIEPLCAACLVKQLEKDYAAYRGRCVVLRPVDTERAGGDVVVETHSAGGEGRGPSLRSG